MDHHGSDVFGAGPKDPFQIDFVIITALFVQAIVIDLASD